MPEIQRNKRTGEMRIMGANGWQPYTAPAEPAPTAVSDSEPGTFAGGAMSELFGLKGLKNTAKDVVDYGKGYLGGFANGVNPIEAISGMLGLGKRVAHDVVNPNDMLSDARAIKAGVTDPTNYTAENIGNVAGNVSGGAVLGKVASSPRLGQAAQTGKRVAGAVATPALNIAETIPEWMGGGKSGVIATARKEIPGVLEGLKKATAGPEPPSQITRGREMFEGSYTPSEGAPPARQPYGEAPTGRDWYQQHLDDTSGPKPFEMEGQTYTPNAEGSHVAAPTAPKSMYQQMQDAGVFQGDRTTGSFTEGAGGLSDYNAGRIGRTRMMPEITSEPGVSDIPGLSIGELDQPRLMSEVPVSKAKQAADALARVSSDRNMSAPAVKPIARMDSQWGPGSTTKTGELSMAGPLKGEPGYTASKSASPIYDPQTPTAYLREQLSQATDPAERQFLAKAIAQRSTIDRAKAASGALAGVQ